MAFHDSLDHQDLTPLALPAQIKKYKILYCNKIQSFSIEMHKQTWSTQCCLFYEKEENDDDVLCT